jgi:hypothetical protein
MNIQYFYLPQLTKRGSDGKKGIVIAENYVDAVCRLEERYFDCHFDSIEIEEKADFKDNIILLDTNIS